MAETTGIVKEVKGNKVIVTTSKGACTTCPLSKVCSINEIEEIEAIKGDDLKVGDKVLLYNSESKLIIFAFVLFLLPLIVLVSVYALLPNGLKEGIRMLIALFVMGLYFVLLGIFEKKFKDRFILPIARKER